MPKKRITEAAVILIMPVGKNFGWGICGKYLARELSRLEDTLFFTESFTADSLGDELEEKMLRKISLPLEKLHEFASADQQEPIRGAVIQAIQGNNLLPWGPVLQASKRIGYTFFEDNILTAESIAGGKRHFDVVVAGSTWCESILKNYGISNARTVIQGIDPVVFNDAHNAKSLFEDSFVIFSGGKLELRKGQDLVLRAFRHLQQKYDNVVLINSWFNHWQGSLLTMGASPYIRFPKPQSDYSSFMNELLSQNGILPAGVISLPPKPNELMAKIYKNSDIGLFPNRCEGGTNLVLMEYMACGKPAIASFSSGHCDILRENNSLPLRTMKKMKINTKKGISAVWDDPDLDEIISRLEWAYENRDSLAAIGRQAGEDLSRLTWTQSARDFLAIVREP